ncbi:MAG: hypothetical protein US95_C0056G0010 [Candidatus Woesebacteria bacterium GW2011_GWB1_38_5]|uniref:Uncharacterized protein n=4 Tax=Candidatus Woeseibacteriota TaxID=1752722 RepID=A0A0G0L6S5_9BACT|nr:MAG: hypothetical protein US67_C0026G0008 [Candidatus Woesebacteria bacterium GW2011_GWD1_38_10]KKQ56983.1 MAG: hypothetical protein US75_C0001G0040 [Candidatus Woesebacteria bacterium GW2011_GWC1_38_13]KKQ73427.1 MAG: hypothetical protein US95_C0056G0010 [Candidatus Woesebacteria bacterium GW2011_GWB1_38_5]KKQ74849.1 MAG: hypothetical protein US97_C0055G0002 [Microgenomates group bacterium GW2011_GWF1_38_5]KKQ83560.1 MAG: hypothetical protein UT06_C0020G0023 [Candidatus Woesebacteria bacter
MQKDIPIYNVINTRYHRGQSILEVILALAILSIIITAIVSLTSTSVNTSTYSKNVSQANRYADEVVEYIRKEKEFSGWSDFTSDIITAYGGIWCMPDLTFTINEACDPLNNSHFISSTIFQRMLTATPINDNSIDIDVEVVWTDDKGLHQTKSSTTVSNW